MQTMRKDFEPAPSVAQRTSLRLYCGREGSSRRRLPRSGVEAVGVWPRNDATIAMRLNRTTRVLEALAAPLSLLSAFVPNAGAAGELLRDVVFADYSELSRSAERAHRMLSPLVAAQIERHATRSGKKMVEQAIRLSDEKFVLYRPSQSVAGRYALLVFVPPWQDARLPPGWAAALDRYGVIYVSAARSGNEESVLDRREPLALLAAQNVLRRYPVDPDRVYVGGFSGGARVAMRLALAYPDVFRGAILNAGSDPIGDPQVPLPPKELFFRFQDSSHIVYVTGAADTSQLSSDLASMRSMRKLCVFDVESHVEPAAGHEAAGTSALFWALSALQHGARADSAVLAACRSGIEKELDRKIQQVESLTASGRHDDAQQLLLRIDAQYGELAAPRSVGLARF